MNTLSRHVDEIIDRRAKLLSYMGGEHRLRVLIILRQGEASVRFLAKETGLTHSALSQHLAKLRKAKLVKTRRDGQTIHYSCSSPAVLKMLDVLDEIYRKPDEDL